MDEPTVAYAVAIGELRDAAIGEANGHLVLRFGSFAFDLTPAEARHIASVLVKVADRIERASKP